MVGYGIPPRPVFVLARAPSTLASLDIATQKGLRLSLSFFLPIFLLPSFCPHLQSAS